MVLVPDKPALIELDCCQVIRELSDYVEADLTPQLRLQIESHLKNCAHCMAVYDGLRNVVRLLGDEKAIELPEGFSERLYKRLNGSKMRARRIDTKHPASGSAQISS